MLLDSIEVVGNHRTAAVVEGHSTGDSRFRSPGAVEDSYFVAFEVVALVVHDCFAVGSKYSALVQSYLTNLRRKVGYLSDYEQQK